MSRRLDPKEFIARRVRQTHGVTPDVRQALADYRQAQRRYRAALCEALPPGTPIRFTAHNGRTYDGGIVAWPEGISVVVRNLKTDRTYQIFLNCIGGLL